MAVGSEDWGEPAVLSAERKRKQLEVGSGQLAVEEQVLNEETKRWRALQRLLR